MKMRRVSPPVFAVACLLAAGSTACSEPKKKGPAPDLVSIDPVIGFNGASTSVTVLGDGFKESARLFLDTEPDRTELTSIALVSDTRLNAVVPSGIAPGTYDVLARNKGSKTGRLEAAFTVTDQPPPVVTAVDPDTISNVIANDVHVSGTGFFVGDGDVLPAVSIGTLAVDAVFVDETELIASLPAGALAAGTYDVTVVNPDGQWGALASGLTVSDEQPPAIVLVIPAAVTTLQIGTAGVAVLGQGFETGATLELMMGTTSGDPVLVSVVSTAIQFTVIPSTMVLGLYDVIVRQPSGVEVIANDAFEVVDDSPPEIELVTPAFGWNGEVTQITIGGTNFVSTPRVFLVSTAGTLSELTHVGFLNETSVTARVPAALPLGLYGVRLVNPRPFDLSGTKTQAFRVTDIRPPDIDAVSPDVVNLGGEPIVITGTFFDAATPATVFIDLDQDFTADPGVIGVDAGGEQVAAASVIVATAQIDVMLPSLPTGTYPLLVVNGDGQFASYYSLTVTEAASGKLDSFVADPSASLAFGRQRIGLARMEDPLGSTWLYTAGGDDDGSAATAPRRDGEFVAVSLLGDLGTTGTLQQRAMDGTALDNLLDTAREGNGFAVHADHVYVIGGLDGTNRLMT